MPKTVRYVVRCRGCGHKGAFDAEIVTQTVQGRDYTNPTIVLAPQDHIVPAAFGGTRIACPGWLYLRIPDGRAWRRFVLDFDGVARNALMRLGLWCPCGKVNQLKVEPLKATRNEAKRCGSACHAAISSTCDCSCGGEHHASAWIPQIANQARIGA